MIVEHKDVLESCAQLLLDKEKIGREEFEALFGGEPSAAPEENGEGVVIEPEKM